MFYDIYDIYWPHLMTKIGRLSSTLKQTMKFKIFKKCLGPGWTGQFSVVNSNFEVNSNFM